MLIICAKWGPAMKNAVISSTSVVALIVGGVALVPSARGQDVTKAVSPPVYDPYPPGILPANINSEIMRVQREITGIFKNYLLQWHQLGPVVVTGNPPIIQGDGYNAIRILGGLLNYDLNMSPLKDVACSSCHMPYTGFAGPIPSVNLTMVAYPGSYHYRAQKRSAQTYTYSPYFPVLQYDTTNMNQSFLGGNFWDGRSTGYLLASPDAEQAQHPPVDPGEMALPDTACIAYRLTTAVYRSLFKEIWGDVFTIKWPANTERICDTPNGAAVFHGSATPIALSPADRTQADQIYDHWGQSISGLERSNDISPFTSKFDAFLGGTYFMTADESAGYRLFNGKGNCNSCHLDGLATTLTAGMGATAAQAPLFTCFGYANEGLPLNPRIALFYESKPDHFGYTMNPYGFGYRDLGVGTFLRSGFGAAPNPNSAWIPLAPASDGQMQVLTARNVAMTPLQCPTTEAGQTNSSGAPVPYFQKEFFHNGYAKSLKQLVHFYNTRDVYPYKVTSGHCPTGKTEKVDCWPMPEVPNNIDMTTGSLGLTDKEENQVVAFLQMLSDGYSTPYPNANTFTGKCQTGGSAATQGNESLIPTPPLPPCASAICDVSPVPGPNPIP